MRISNLGLFAVWTLLSKTFAVSNFNGTSTSNDSGAVSSSTKIGDFVAAGLGLTRTTTSTERSTSPTRSQAIVNDTLASSNTYYGNLTRVGGNTVTTSWTSYFSSCQPTTTDSRGQLHADCSFGSTIVMNTLTNTTWASATNVDDCWTEWNSYWSMHTPTPATISVISYSAPATTETTEYTYTDGSYVTDQTTTKIITSTAPTVVDNGGFIKTIPEVVVTYSTVLTSFLSPKTTSTSTSTLIYTPYSQNYTLISAFNDPDWPTPSCTLPAVYPACQSQWEEYATHNAAPNPQPLPTKCDFDLLNYSQSAPACYTDGQSSWASWRSYIAAATSPVCSQASITGALCTSLKDAYVLGYNNYLGPDLPEPASFSSGYYSNAAPWFTGWTWPATQAFAPACTLDCGRCAVTGGTIQLLYFPPGLTHPATEPIVATTLGTVLTSPTYYISFASLYASDACNGVGSTLTSMILPIPTSEPLSTLFATTLPCDAHRENNVWLGLIDIGTAALNVTDLMQDPVPYSIYTSQPYCASQIAAAGCRPDSCPTTLPYRPLIVLSSQLLNTLDPAWATCSLDLRGLYDPPKALQPATAVVLPTMPGAAPTTSATPASGPASVTPDPTAQPDQVSPTPSQTPTPSPSPPVRPLPSPSAGNEASTPTGASDPALENPAPTASHTSAQTKPDNPVSIIVSLLAGASRDTVSSHNSAVDPGTSAPGANTNHSPPPDQDSTSSDDGSPRDHSPIVFTVGSQGITATPGQPLVVADSTLSHNAEITIGGQTYSLGIAGLIVDGTSIIELPGNGNQASAVVFTIDSQILTASAVGPAHPSAIVVGDTTLTRGGSVATIGGTILSAGAAELVLDGTQTIPLSHTEPAPTTTASQVVLTLGSRTIAAFLPLGTGNAIIIDGTTLTPGGSPVTIGSAIVSAGNAGLEVDGTKTIPLANTRSTLIPTASQAVLTLGSRTITAFSPLGTGNEIILDGTTLSPGGSAATIDGTEASAGTAGIVVGGTRTVSFTTAGDSPQTTTRSVSASSTKLDPSSTVSTAQSGTGRASKAGSGLLCSVLVICLVLVL